MKKMSGNCAKELLLLVLFVVAYPSFGSNCDGWREEDFPSFVPESTKAQEEFCGIIERTMELSKNQLEEVIRKWAAKYNVSVNNIHYR